MCIISREFMSQGKGKNLILLKLHVDFLRDLWLRGDAKTHSALVAVQGFIQEKFSTVVYSRKGIYISKHLNLEFIIYTQMNMCFL